jgi:hypothetical protein
MTNAGSLAGMSVACPRIRNRHGALWQAAFRVAAHGAVDAGPQGSRERSWRQDLPEIMGREEGSRRGHVLG